MTDRGRARRFLPLAALFAAIVAPAVVSAWGSIGHSIVVGEAARLTPDGLRGFLEANSSNLTLLASEPDAMSVMDSSTGPDHYIDLDAWSKPPFDDVPSHEAVFIAKFGKDALKEGRLPWAVRDQYNALVAAMKARDIEEALRRAGHLAHFVSDATMPLHATKNYKGQSSGNVIFDAPEDPNRHVHVRFEIGMIAANRRDVEATVRKCIVATHVVTDPAAEAMDLAKDAYSDIDAILTADRELLKAGAAVTPEYFAAMYRQVGDIATTRLALAATEIASYWTSAWVEAGRPSLPAAQVVLRDKPLTFEKAVEMRKAREAVETAK